MLYNIKELVWDKWNIEHIKKHNVNTTDVEESCCQSIKSFRSYQSKLIILGKTKSNRLITVVLIRKGKGIYYIVTARDMSRKERKLINEK